MLSAVEIAAMRALQDEALPDTCTIMRATSVSDGMGGMTSTWANVATDVACRLATTASYRPAEGVTADMVALTVMHMLTLPALTDIESADRVDVGGTVYEVAGVLSPGGATETARRVLLSKVG